MTSRLPLFPNTTRIETGPDGERLTVAGCNLGALAERYGTPLYLYDRQTLDAAVQAYQETLDATYPGEAGITYAGKAYLCLAIAQWVEQRGLWIDCTGAGEIGIATAAGVAREHILVHGVNKSQIDLEAALANAARIVVDNLDELGRLVRLLKGQGSLRPEIWLRFRPGLAVETHAYIQTGQDDSKFGMGWEEMVEAGRVCREHDLPLKGLHFHQGSHFFEPEPVRIAIERTLDLAAALKMPDDWTLCPGGGLGVAYHEEDLPGPSIREYVRFVAENLVEGCHKRGLVLPRLQVEPGRSLVARAGVAIYRVGAVKWTAHRRWVLLDGGMADNPRPALYGARYSALPVWEPRRSAEDEAWLGGPYCESGDILIKGLALADVQAGELIAVPVSGAYQLSMSSNYNGASRPAVLWLEGGQARVIQRREKPEDLVRRDLML